MTSPRPVDLVRRYYDDLGEREWERLIATPRTRISLEVHRRFLTRFIRPGWRVLEVGAGPGRFTIELGRLGAQVVVTDLSPVQLELNARHVGATPFESAVERRELLDVCDTTRYPDGAFDAVVAYGGPLSYAFDEADAAFRGLLRITRPGGPVVASVMSLLGSWRFFLADLAADAAAAGEAAMEGFLRSGDLRHLVHDEEGHIGRMFRWRDLEDLVHRNGGRMLAGSASNFASLGEAPVVARLEEDPGRWDLFVEHEVAACRELGVRDAGTHILFAAEAAP